ncbi:YfcE family phosphodiesterase [Lacticaseibacillus brantae]|uniref:Phosphoesterase n=1 Tax=Lacticaseibacillus brantae DSM 23927 TaxID=1423727 RepID=A0A0R2B661_9LACO|nr:phosphoesterase [Lacticaseibacillus brantae DSM 23927]
MEILAVSDTHGDAAILQTLLARHPNLDGYFYAGDSELTATNPLFETYRAVAGNMDFDPEFPMTVTETIDGETVFMAHGHRYGVNFGLDDLVAAGQDAHANIILFGHTHQLGVEMHAGILVLNPGSISQPRGEFAHLGGTYALITATPTAFDISYRTRDGENAGLDRHFDRK